MFAFSWLCVKIIITKYIVLIKIKEPLIKPKIKVKHKIKEFLFFHTDKTILISD